MAESSSAHIDESKIPPYPKNPTTTWLEPKSRGSRPISLDQSLDEHSTSQSLNASGGSFDFPVDMQELLGCYVCVPLNDYSSSGCYHDNTSFNLWNKHGDIALQVSFRRKDQTIRLNSASGSSGWGNESIIPFPSSIAQERNVVMKINLVLDGSYWLYLDDDSWSINVQPKGPPNSITYRGGSDAMFGQNVDATFYYMA
ncbi:hypothetical protein F5884DRAFT_762844 [Xylogone sp. PMI_703]|nr:hypothetical protein F5884DRAFT_762844 [Xylogone sp. PMI_703]